MPHIHRGQALEPVNHSLSSKLRQTRQLLKRGELKHFWFYCIVEKLIIYLIKMENFYWKTPTGFISLPAVLTGVTERAELSLCLGIDAGFCGKVRKVNW